MRKWWIIIIIIVVLLVASFIRIGASRRRTKIEEIKQAAAVEVMPATRGSVVSTCEVLGAVVADKTAPVLPETMGRVTKILVKEGSYITKDSQIMALRNETVGFEYEEGYIKAPISGNVAKIFVDIGSMITPQTPVAMIVEFSTVKVSFNMSENAIGCITKGGKVEISVDAFPARQFSGTISEISPVVDPMTRTVSARAVINNPKKILKPGMTARVILTLGSKNNVLAIPRDALLDGYLFIVKDSTAERRDVEIGLIGDKNVEILSGIKEGENIIVVGQQRLAGGEKVHPLKKGSF